MTAVDLSVYTPLATPPMTARSSPRPRVDGKGLSVAGHRYRVRGVTYGPFAPDPEGYRFPGHSVACDDLDRMALMGVNSVRVYEVPPTWLLEEAAARGLRLLVDVPWFKNHCFLDDQTSIREIRRTLRSAASHCRDTGAVLGYSVGNEIRPDVVRWHGAARVERFLAELGDVIKQADPEALTTYASYPPTEYLDTSGLDFATFNVYLHDDVTFRNYLYRLQNLVGDRPLILGEIGMDTIRHGEAEQASFLAGHLKTATLLGLAGGFVFSWTDEWHCGGQLIEDWAFGINTVDRTPKLAVSSVAEVFSLAPSKMLKETPRVSVVVCSYNGGRTLAQCLESLEALDYPDYEVILVDDGSTDDTRSIAARFPGIQAIHQPNLGLSEARNVGLRASTGSIVAYTDSDCFADPDWLSLLVAPLIQTDAKAVGGPNLTPDDGWLAACVAAAPGQPTHVLENDQTAEHIPGCNMAFRREALEEINGFLPHYRKAGDDVDVCWRLQQAGHWITFAPGAFVWHHRRQDPAAFLKQQRGYGEAEALLWFDHPDRFNGRGEGKWRGTMYGASLQGIRIGRPVIYRGVFAAGMFQTIYQPGPAHWLMLPMTLEWVVATLMIALLAIAVPEAWVVAALMAALPIVLAMVRASQASLPRRYDGTKARLIVAGLCLAQPMVRSWARYRTYFFPFTPTIHDDPPETPAPLSIAPGGDLVVGYWDETGRGRITLLDSFSGLITTKLRPMRIDAGWSEWDFEVFPHAWTSLRIETVQEGEKACEGLFRVRYKLRPSVHARAACGVMLVLAAVLATFGPTSAILAFGAVATLAGGAWWHALRLARRVVGLIDEFVIGLGLMRCEVGPRKAKAWSGDDVA